jgi:hypothetical protein
MDSKAVAFIASRVRMLSPKTRSFLTLLNQLSVGGVIPAVALATHETMHPVSGVLFLEGVTGVLAMQDEARGRLAAEPSHGKGVGDEIARGLVAALVTRTQAVLAYQQLHPGLAHGEASCA